MTRRVVSRPLASAATLCALVLAQPAAAKDLIEYFQPTPIHAQLVRSSWGASNVQPRDTQNGLEDTSNKYCYWDGRIIKGSDGKYHMFASRWDESKGHNGWSGSVAVHAVSDRPDGPYVDKGLAYTNQNGKGHNVTALELPDGRFAILVSETRPGDVFISNSLDGSFEYQGSIKIDPNGHDATGTTSNVSVIIRPDGSYLAVSRHGIVMLSKNGIMGPYVVQGGSVYPKIQGLNNANAEDPMIWYSGGTYHMTVNWWDARQAYHLTSKDGITGWKNEGLAYQPDRAFIRYTDGTVNKWNKIERPGVLIENEHVTHFIFAVLDVPKEQELGNDNHGNKVILVPFDGVQFDKDTGADGGGIAGSGGMPNGGAGGGASGGHAGSDLGGASAGNGGVRSGGAGGVAGLAGSESAGMAAGGASGAGTGGMVTNAGVSIAGTPSNVGGTATTAPNGTVPPASPEDAGCSCRVGSNAPSRAARALLTVAALLGLRRRRASSGN